MCCRALCAARGGAKMQEGGSARARGARSSAPRPDFSPFARAPKGKTECNNGRHSVKPGHLITGNTTHISFHGSGLSSQTRKVRLWSSRRSTHAAASRRGGRSSSCAPATPSSSRRGGGTRSTRRATRWRWRSTCGARAGEARRRAHMVEGGGRRAAPTATWARP